MQEGSPDKVGELSRMKQKSACVDLLGNVHIWCPNQRGTDNKPSPMVGSKGLYFIGTQAQGQWRYNQPLRTDACYMGMGQN